MNQTFNTPILFIIFNRPETTKKVFEIIRQIKPSKLFIAADGPRSDKLDEVHLCDESRKTVSKIDWQCEVKTLYREKNLGCKIAVSSAINWFFENAEEGIILEDDCLPDPSFFIFCEQMLERYRNDLRIMHIGGDNFQFGRQRGNGDYYFSKMSHVWGWATWRRAWKYYDVEMKSLEDFIKNNYIKDIFNNKKIIDNWLKILNETKNNEIDTWDYQWTYTIWSQNGLSIIPNKNLVGNIGFGNNATHTKTMTDSIRNNRVHTLFIKKHPAIIARDYNADVYYNTMKINIIDRIQNKILNLLKIKK